jgi:hypothetical protein
MAKKKLPKKLFMRWNTDTSEPFLDHDEDANLLAEKGQTVEAGEYELKRKVKLINTTVVKPV